MERLFLLFILNALVFLSWAMQNKKYASHFQSANEEDDLLSPEETRRRLRLFLAKVDENKDGYLTMKELEHWVRIKYDGKLNEDDAAAMFRECDINFDYSVTWDEYLLKKYRIDEKENDGMTIQLKKNFDTYIIRDKRRWKYADLDKNNELEEYEFHLFAKPKEYKEMMELVAYEELEHADQDKDGYLSMEEYIDSIHLPDMRNFYENKFRNEYDQNNDGRLDVNEVKLWKTPEVFDKSKSEAKQLIDIADENNDGMLSLKEIDSHHFLFAGSKVTVTGKLLHDEF